MRRLPTSELLRSPDMSLRARNVGWLSVYMLCLVPACAGKSAPVATQAALDPSAFYPFRAGNAWSYDVDTGEASTTLAITRVEIFDGNIAQVRTANAVLHYEVLPEGIRVLPSDAWLIRAPVRAGATWPAPGGRTAELVSTDVVAETPAGRFDGCVEVREVGGKLELEVRTIYCPGIGPVSVTSVMRSNVSERALTVSARLRGYSVSPRTSDP
jgi:hypothetical protein